MTQAERRMYLIKSLLAERQDYLQAEIPQGEQDQKELLRALFNIRPPQPVSDAFLKIQDCYLQWETAQKGVVDADDLTAVQQDIYIWQGDITTLKCDAIVNAANSRLLGCFCPCHGCIDNAIHTFSGVHLRLACAALMEKQGHEEPAGRAKSRLLIICRAGMCAYRRAAHSGRVDKSRLRIACFVLPFLPCFGGGERVRSMAFLLHIYRRISFSERSGSRNSGAGSAGI